MVRLKEDWGNMYANGLSFFDGQRSRFEICVTTVLEGSIGMVERIQN